MTEIMDTNKFDKFSPLRVDFAGGWLDTPGENRTGGFVVNCSISPLVSKENWPYSQRSGLGGSAAWAFVNHINPFKYDIEHGNGWQDSAIVSETGCCVWKSGNAPILDFKCTGEFLTGRMALYDTKIPHDTAILSQKKRDIHRITEISKIARIGVLTQNIDVLALAVSLTYQEQLKEEMNPLPYLDLKGLLAVKYCGSGHGGYGLYIFSTPNDRDNAIRQNNSFIPIEPYCRLFSK